jgi:hypothetical protein
MDNMTSPVLNGSRDFGYAGLFVGLGRICGRPVCRDIDENHIKYHFFRKPHMWTTDQGPLFEYAYLLSLPVFLGFSHFP